MAKLGTSPWNNLTVGGGDLLPFLTVSVRIAIVGLLLLTASAIPLVAGQDEATTSPPSAKNVASTGGEVDPVVLLGREMAQWLHRRGGYMSDKLEIRRRIPGDTTSPSGVFAIQDISPNEKLFHFPHEAYMKVPEDQIIDLDPPQPPLDDSNGEAYKEYLLLRELAEINIYFDNCCLLAKRLLDEIHLYRTSPSSSEFAPFIQYLEETQPRGQLPAAYSPEGKALLRKIQGMTVMPGSDDEYDSTIMISPNFGRSPLPPFDLVDWIDEKFVKRGCFPAEDVEAYHAAALIIQRGFDLELIPIWDMVNHEVIEKVNVETNSLRSQEGLVVHAKQAIAAGDEILYTYNFCTDCMETGLEWGTPGMYRDFGFVEDYPQIWPFLDQEVYATIQQQQQQEYPQFTATFYSEIVDGSFYHYIPNESAIDFFHDQLARLQALDIHTEIQKVPSSHERSMIQKFYSSLVTALAVVAETGIQLLEEAGDDNEEGGDDNYEGDDDPRSDEL